MARWPEVVRVARDADGFTPQRQPKTVAWLLWVEPEQRRIV